MRKFFVAALALAAVLTPAALALPGSVSVTSSATDVTCNGVSTVSITLQSVAPPPEDVPLDLVIAIDESGSLNATNFNLEKQAAIDFVNALDFTGGVRKVGVIGFSLDARTIVNLSNNKQTVINAINGMFQRMGATNITDALRDSRAMLTGALSQPGAAKVMLLMTDGQNTVETSQLNSQVAAFKAMPGEIFALGFGNSISVSQLNMIASDPDSTHVYITPDSTELSGIALDIAEQIQNPAATDLELRAVAGAPFSYIAGSAISATGTTAPIAGGFSWSLPTLGTETQTVRFAVRHSGVLNGTFAALSSLTLDYLDGDLNAASLTPPSPQVVVSGCNREPTADAGADQAIPLAGSPTALVGMDGTASSDPDGDALSYEWSQGTTSLGTGVTPTVPFGLGTHTITLTVTDPAGLSDTDEVVVTVFDPTPPAITSTVDGTLGDNGWYVSTPTIRLSAADPESPVTTSGCGTFAVTADTSGASFTCSASSAGGDSSETVSVKVDTTAPALAFAGNAGTYSLTDTVAITCSATDATSGLASSDCPAASGPAIDFVGTNTLNASATDNAGNTAVASTTFTVLVDAASICELVDAYVDQHGVAHALCVKLQHDSIRAFENHVNAQRGKRLTDVEADLLIELARAL